MVIAIVLIEIFIIILLILYNKYLHNRYKQIEDSKEHLDDLLVVRELIEIAGSNKTSDKKLKNINKTIVEKFNVTYSTIIIFEGNSYEIKATNLDVNQQKYITEIYKNSIFKDSVNSGEPVFLKVSNQKEKLPYLKIELDRVKSAMFFPMHIDKIFIGFWIVEASKINGLDHLDIRLMDSIKDTIVDIIQMLRPQEAFENLVKTDKYSNLKTAEYIYGEGKNIIDKYSKTTIAMVKINNLEKINELYGRKQGDAIVTEVSNVFKNFISKEYVVLRYSGPKFLIAFPNIDISNILIFLEQLKEQVEQILILANGEEIKPFVNIAATTYYRGVSLDKLNNRLERFLDSSTENTITRI